MRTIGVVRASDNHRELQKNIKRLKYMKGDFLKKEAKIKTEVSAAVNKSFPAHKHLQASL